MTRRHYGQDCSIASALDRIGERWSLLIVRELLLGPLRFSELVRAVGGAPTDVVTRRLRDLEEDGIVRRRDSAPPAAGVVYELTEVGRGLERTVIELGRWGLNFYELEDVSEVEPAWLPGALLVILQPAPEDRLTVQLRCEGRAFALWIADGQASGERGEADDPDLVLSGTPAAVIGLLVTGESGVGREASVEGDRGALERLRTMIVMPERLLEEARAVAAAPAAV